ncbi:MAG: hypothetical protein A2900_02265 [Candidatus Chisholmbacteria bacterium RIFCSPLOWO2_01_FULL_50_28]|uniref:Uncharacterized protein n=1 Tax=Candidatus Chisholmbacteria bacterium RIFCSPHIGHO2_01_FULL_52_32 TaxID=1797591 RepID=A0A1G1VTL2_9BACT|nr:MAG: hypothetical protein A2786_04480 [Candidatus Chisholmbacteria bacterium RIFCSPHIGHO2_01_FULL_52_32]OGY19908.1 MAG: hypothetical protein A2900_02265 [Candidatus Chisholmbacteria bacterium RIFCSPLOWO2_01_FULL_50_28]
MFNIPSTLTPIGIFPVYFIRKRIYYSRKERREKLNNLRLGPVFMCYARIRGYLAVMCFSIPNIVHFLS